MICLYALSEAGRSGRERLLEALAAAGETCRPAELEDLKNDFCRENLLVFFCAAGVVVRKIAPLLKSKEEDPPVLVLDPGCHYVLSLLSGHLGGANAWARRIAAMMGAEAVITTATDGAGLLAPDRLPALFGAELLDPRKILDLNRKLLRGEALLVRSELLVSRLLPSPYRLDPEKADLIWSDDEMQIREASGALRLRARNYCLGIGCRRGLPTETLRQGAEAFLKSFGLSLKVLRGLASLDVKSDEPAILDLAESLKLDARFYSAEALKSECGRRAYTLSPFVEQSVGTPAVAAPAAVLLAGEERNKLVEGWKTLLPSADPVLASYLNQLLELSSEAPELCGSWRGEGMSLALCPVLDRLPERKGI